MRHPDLSLKEIYATILEPLRRYSVNYVLDPIKWIVGMEVKISQFGGPKSVTYVVVRPGFPGKLPYCLQADTDMSGFAIGRLVGRNKQVHEGVVSRSLSFFHDDLSIVVGFDEPSNHLAFLRIESIDPSDLARLRFYDGLNAQQASLVDSMDDCLAQWQSANPVHCWRQRMAEGDSIFNGNGGIGEG
ncbi:hypothetical protein [Paenibacillus chitinolyticus]